MSFKLRYECEFCGYEILSRKQDLPDICPECNDTGDTRSNIEKYNCKDCEYFLGNDTCKLYPALGINNMICHKQFLE